MRLAFLTLILGFLVGFAAHSFMVDHPRWHLALTVEKPVVPETAHLAPPGPAKPRIYPSPEKTIAQLKKQFDEAVVVVLADESYDDNHKLVRVSVVEVWKGPVDLAGKTMDARLEAPLSYLHTAGTQRVLKFMPMTPHLDTSGTVYFKDETLRMNPVVSVNSLREALMKRQEKG